MRTLLCSCMFSSQFSEKLNGFGTAQTIRARFSHLRFHHVSQIDLGALFWRPPHKQIQPASKRSGEREGERKNIQPARYI